jgi:hypothetical protein
VLDRADGWSSLTASLSTAAELLKDRVDVMIANGVRWGTRSVLFAALSDFPKLEAELELLVSSRNVALTEDQVNAL